MTAITKRNMKHTNSFMLSYLQFRNSYIIHRTSNWGIGCVSYHYIVKPFYDLDPFHAIFHTSLISTIILVSVSYYSSNYDNLYILLLVNRFRVLYCLHGKEHCLKCGLTQLCLSFRIFVENVFYIYIYKQFRIMS